MGLLNDIYDFFMHWYPILFDNLLEKNPLARILEVVGITALSTVVLCIAVLPVVYILLVPALIRLWNFCVVETIYELIYIITYSNPMKRPSIVATKILGSLQKSTDSMRLYLNNDPSNAQKLESGKTISYRAFKNKKSKTNMTYVFIFLSILFVLTFCISTGLYEITFKPLAMQNQQNELQYETMQDTTIGNEVTNKQETVMKLNSRGIKGSKVRSEPSTLDSDVLEIVSGDIELIYLNSSNIEISGDEWINIRTPSGIEGWISSSLVEAVE